MGDVSELRPIPGYDGYLVSSDGRVFSCWTRGAIAGRRENGAMRFGGSRVFVGESLRELARFDRGDVHGDPTGYLSVSLGRGRTRHVHALVALAFYGPAPSEFHEVCHGNGKRDDNRADNLRWDTPKANARDRAMHAGERARAERLRRYLELRSAS